MTDQFVDANKMMPITPPPELVASLRNSAPQPPSLKERALHELNDVYNRDKIEDSTYDTIRRALEQLDE